MNNYPVGNFLISIKNAAIAGKKELEFPFSKLLREISKMLVKEGFLEEVKVNDRKIIVRLVYRKKEPLITDIKLISKPGLRIYMGVEELEEKKGPSIFIVSTPKGIISSRQAIKLHVGGEVIAEIL